ncbi:MAG: peptidoglycan editing factor PgeF [Polyangia bacterium]|jgi:YfiH family protein
MEERAAKSDDGVALPLLVAPGLDAFRHGFTTRAGGVSRAPFDSLNLGGKWGDRPDDVYENYRRLLAVAGVRRMYRVSQVHGVRVVRVGRGDALDEMAATPADGLCTDEPGLGVAVHVADCTPILLACPRTGAVAALHAGWRGTAAGMAKAGVATMVTHFGCHPHELRAALGPCIGACCCEVGPEVVAAFVAADAQARDNGSVVSGPAKEHIDLRRVQALELIAMGLAPDHIDASRDCTRCDPRGRFFSFRGAGGKTGQAVGFVVAGNPG